MSGADRFITERTMAKPPNHNVSAFSGGLNTIQPISHSERLSKPGNLSKVWFTSDVLLHKTITKVLAVNITHFLFKCTVTGVLVGSFEMDFAKNSILRWVFN